MAWIKLTKGSGQEIYVNTSLLVDVTASGSGSRIRYAGHSGAAGTVKPISSNVNQPPEEVMDLIRQIETSRQSGHY
ncbi:hypothetical protein [Methylobacterium sp. Leaf85]|uniref:hypothetical protein n=1 Tax=Methylobacterium sp. Leaf85 TaxID=1736241 RepID=UPI000AFAA100|nr:hypothetical protein [Methylobacterium sp. Leaf85]